MKELLLAFLSATRIYKLVSMDVQRRIIENMQDFKKIRPEEHHVRLLDLYIDRFKQGGMPRRSEKYSFMENELKIEYDKDQTGQRTKKTRIV